MTTIWCCYPRRFLGPSGVMLRHTCEGRKGQPYDGVRKVTDALTKEHRIEDAVVGIDRHPSAYGRSEPVHHECTWHQRLGVPFTVSGICVGPACTEYRDAHGDDLDDVTGWGS